MEWWYILLISSFLVLPTSSEDGSWILRNAANELAALLELPRNIKLPHFPINNQVDEIFAGVRVNVSDRGLDPLPLPTDSDDFNVTLFGNTLLGSVSVSNTQLGGLSTIHRTGECAFVPSPLGVIIYVGGNDILLGVDVGLGIGIINAKIKITLYVAHVDIMLSVGRNDSGGFVLNEFRLNEIGRVKFTIDGIPGGGSERITSRLTAVINLVKDSLTYAFQEALRKVIEGILAGTGQ